MTSIYFSDYFGVDPEVLDEYGAFNVSLVGDLPLFVDPFLLFNSENATYQELHAEIIRYMKFLKDVTLAGPISRPLVDAWFAFPEVKQNWLGFTATGNQGHGLGKGFAHALHRNFTTVFRDFGEERVSRSSHLEKLCLVRDGVGRDTVSDFTTNLIKQFLSAYTQEFARQVLPPTLRRKVAVSKVTFNYHTRSWTPQTFELPFINGDYVLLTPKDILTKDEAWINRPDLVHRFTDIADALPDSVLRAQVNDYLARVLPDDADTTQEEMREAITRVIERFPQVLDYYIRDKEDHGEEAVSLLCEDTQSPRYDIVRVRALGFERHNIPVQDFQSPTLGQSTTCRRNSRTRSGRKRVCVQVLGFGLTSDRTDGARWCIKGFDYGPPTSLQHVGAWRSL